MPPDLFTKRVAVLKGHLGIDDKRPDVVALEDMALRLRRQAPWTALGLVETPALGFGAPVGAD